MNRSVNSKLGCLKLDYAKFIMMLLFFILSARPLLASDSDDIDTDGDGYSDQLELKNNYSPFNSQPLKLEKSDADGDGLSDYWELKFKTNPLDPDSDGDGFKDKEELDSLYDPLSSSTKKLVPRLEIDTKKQQLIYFIADQAWKKMVVSTGKPSMPTPRGSFTVINKSSKAWSKTYKLWMPYWLGLNRGEFGIHELPIWPGGYREGTSHLGQAVSHGCIRLGVGDAKYLFDRIATGTAVVIK